MNFISSIANLTRKLPRSFLLMAMRKFSVRKLAIYLIPVVGACAVGCSSLMHAHGYVHGVVITSHVDHGVDQIVVQYGQHRLKFNGVYSNPKHSTGQVQKSPIPQEMTVRWRDQGIYYEQSVPVRSLAGDKRIANWIIDFNDCGFDLIRSEDSSPALYAPRIKTKVHSSISRQLGADESPPRCVINQPGA